MLEPAAAGGPPAGSTGRADPVLRLATSDPQQTRVLAAALAGFLVSGDLVVLTGDLGAGKTCFTQGLGAGLGVGDRITSPTFTIVAEHEGRLPLHHLDAYRLAGPEDALDLDLPELLERGVTVIEWGDRLADALPEEQLRVELRLGDGDDDRRLEVHLLGSRWEQQRSELERALSPWEIAC